MPVIQKLVKNAEKVELVTQLVGFRGNPALLVLSGLLAIMIQETREFNDTAAPEEVLRNQGRIAGLKDLQDYINKGIYRRELDVARDPVRPLHP